jgi:hypothetical protein
MPKEAMEHNINLVLSRQSSLIDCAFRGETTILEGIQRIKKIDDPYMFNPTIESIVGNLDRFEGINKLTLEERKHLNHAEIKRDTWKRKFIGWIPHMYAIGGGSITLASLFISAQLPIRQVQMFGISVNAAVTAVITTAFMFVMVKRGVDRADELDRKYPAANAMKRLESLAEVVDRIIESVRAVSPPAPKQAAPPTPPFQAAAPSSETDAKPPDGLYKQKQSVPTTPQKGQFDKTQKFGAKKQF